MSWSLFVGAALTINGDITIGTIVAFLTYVRIFTNQLVKWLKELPNCNQLVLL